LTQGNSTQIFSHAPDAEAQKQKELEKQEYY